MNHPTNPQLRKRRAKNLCIPFGYKIYEADDEWLEPIPLEQEAIKKAIEYRKQGYPWRSLTDWVVNATNRQISWQGLQKIIEKELAREYSATETKEVRATNKPSKASKEG